MLAGRHGRCSRSNRIVWPALSRPDISCRFVAAAANGQLVGAAFDAAVDRALLAPGHGAAVGDRAAAAGDTYAHDQDGRGLG